MKNEPALNGYHAQAAAAAMAANSASTSSSPSSSSVYHQSHQAAYAAAAAFHPLFSSSMLSSIGTGTNNTTGTTGDIIVLFIVELFVANQILVHVQSTAFDGHVSSVLLRRKRSLRAPRKESALFFYRFLFRLFAFSYYLDSFLLHHRRLSCRMLYIVLVLLYPKSCFASSLLMLSFISINTAAHRSCPKLFSRSLSAKRHQAVRDFVLPFFLLFYVLRI